MSLLQENNLDMSYMIQNLIFCQTCVIFLKDIWCFQSRNHRRHHCFLWRLKMNQNFVGITSIDQLNLDPIKAKLMHDKKWSTEQLNLAEKWYKRFLFINLTYPEIIIVPTSAIDIFWHYHILDTRKYADDCQNIFGTFFHHFPYFGMRGEDDANNHACAVSKTRELFSLHFSETFNELTGMIFNDCNGEVICTGDKNGIIPLSTLSPLQIDVAITH